MTSRNALLLFPRLKDYPESYDGDHCLIVDVLKSRKKTKEARKIGYYQLVNPAGAVIDRFGHTWVMSTQSLEKSLLWFLVTPICDAPKICNFLLKSPIWSIFCQIWSIFANCVSIWSFFGLVLSSFWPYLINFGQFLATFCRYLTNFDEFLAIID